MQSITKREELSAGLFDISVLLSITQKNNWKSLRDSSLGRILYLSTVLYEFMFPNEENIFSKYYKFSYDETGPFCELIKKSLVHLESIDFVFKSELAYYLKNKLAIEETKTEEEKKRKRWLEIVMNLLSVYGEGKIYDFVIRDPLYQNSFQRSTPKEIQIDQDNITLRKLNSFKDAFEKVLGEKAKRIVPQKYLELYFEFIFSTILKGEIDV